MGCSLLCGFRKVLSGALYSSGDVLHHSQVEHYIFGLMLAY